MKWYVKEVSETRNDNVLQGGEREARTSPEVSSTVMETTTKLQRTQVRVCVQTNNTSVTIICTF